MALVTVKLTVSQLVHGRMLPVGEPVQVPESFAAEFVRKGIGQIVAFPGESPKIEAPPPAPEPAPVVAAKPPAAKAVPKKGKR